MCSNVYSACKTVKSRHGGPYDYRDPKNFVHTGTFSMGVIPTVEVHFTPAVERLLHGGRGYLNDDISYTLREIPNHPRALNTASKFEYKKAHDKIFNKKHGDMEVSAECYLQRALKFYPNDSDVYFIYGIHLHRIKKYRQAILMYKRALKLNPDYPEVHYNLGLAYIKEDDLGNAKKYAKLAKDKYYPLKGLQRQIDKYKKGQVKNATE